MVSEGVARWEDNKKWQQKVEALRGKLAEKTREQEKAEKTIAMLREAVNRTEKDKVGLHSRLKRCVLDLFSFLMQENEGDLCWIVCFGDLLIKWLNIVNAGAQRPSRSYTRSAIIFKVAN